MSDEEIINLFLLPDGKINQVATKKLWLNRHPDIYNYLKTRYTDSTSIRETIYRIINKIEIRPICKICGNPVTFVGGDKIFRETCSIKCAKKLTKTVSDITDKQIILNDLVINGKINKNKLQDKYLKEHGYYNYIHNFPLKQKRADRYNKSEIIYLMYHDLSERPKCRYCCKDVQYINFEKGYSKYCTKECQLKDYYRHKEITDHDIIDLLFENGKLNYNKCTENFLKAYSIYDYLMTRFDDTESVMESIYRIYYNIEIRPVCKICGKHVEFRTFEKGFNDGCCYTCQYRYLSENNKKPINDQIINDEYIKKIYTFDTIQQLGTNTRKINIAQSGLYDYLINRFEGVANPREAIYMILHDIKEKPKCPICGKSIKFRDFYHAYKETCCEKCRHILERKRHYKEKYGLDCDFDGRNIIIHNGCPIHGDVILNTETFHRRILTSQELCPICHPFYKMTSIEGKIVKILEKLDIQCILHERNQIYPQELDIFLPDYNTGIECNGMYWHNDKHTESDKGFIKYSKCIDKGVKLLIFWDDDIMHNIGKIENILKIVCKCQQKIKLSDCMINVIDYNDTIQFIDKYSIETNIKIDTCIGLFYKGELIEVMTFNSNELTNVIYNGDFYVKNSDISLIKYYSDYSGYDDLLFLVSNELNFYPFIEKYFEKINDIPPTRIIFDINKKRRISDGNIENKKIMFCYNAGHTLYQLKNKGF